MNNESNLVLELWELVRDQLPSARRHDVAVGLFRAVAEYGFEARDLEDLLDEEPLLARAYREVFEDDESEDDDIDYEALDDDDE